MLTREELLNKTLVVIKPNPEYEFGFTESHYFQEVFFGKDKELLTVLSYLTQKDLQTLVNEPEKFGEHFEINPDERDTLHFKGGSLMSLCSLA